MYTLIAENKYGEQLEISSDPRYTISEIDGLYPPEAVINTTKTANVDGSVFNSSYVNDRVITITLAINSPAEENRLNLFKYFKTKYPVRLYFKNEARDVYIDGYVQKMPIEYFEKKQVAQIVIDCPMALFNGREESAQIMSNNESLFTFPFYITNTLVALSSVEPGGDQVIVNSGDVETGVVITIIANSTVLNPKIINMETLEFMALDTELQAGDEVTINTRIKEKSIKLLRDGEISNIIGTLQAGSTWFKLVPGNNVFTYAADEFPEQMQCAFTINSQYEGV